MRRHDHDRFLASLTQAHCAGVQVDPGALVPGGARSVVKLAPNPHTRRIVSAFVDDQKPVAFVGQGVEVLAIVDRARGVTVAGAPESRATLE